MLNQRHEGVSEIRHQHFQGSGMFSVPVGYRPSKSARLFQVEGLSRTWEPRTIYAICVQGKEMNVEVNGGRNTKTNPPHKRQMHNVIYIGEHT